MKKYIIFLVCIAVSLSLVACGRAAIPDEYTMPISPSPLCESECSVGISVDSPLLLSTLLGTQLGDSSGISLGASIVPESGGMSVLLNQKYGTADKISSIELSPDGNYAKNTDADGNEHTEDFFAYFFRELLVSESLGYIGSQRGGYKYNAEFLSELGKYATLEWEENPLEQTKIAVLTFNGEQMALLLEAVGEESPVSDVIRAFYSGESDGMVTLEDAIGKLRDDEKFAFTEKLTLHVTSGRVLLADITAKSESVVFSLVYDGSTADITATARHSEDNVIAEFSSKHEDSRTTYTLRSVDGNDINGARLVLTDGSVYAEWTTGESERVQASFKYDGARREFEVRIVEYLLVVGVSEDTLVGTFRKGQSSRELTITFDTAEQTDSGVRYAVTRIGDIDVPAGTLSVWMK